MACRKSQPMHGERRHSCPDQCTIRTFAPCTHTTTGIASGFPIPSCGRTATHPLQGDAVGGNANEREALKELSTPPRANGARRKYQATSPCPYRSAGRGQSISVLPGAECASHASRERGSRQGEMMTAQRRPAADCWPVTSWTHRDVVEAWSARRIVTARYVPPSAA